jgi:anti-anti-sigma factor
MVEPLYRHVTSTLTQGVLVLTVTEHQIRGDDLAESIGKEMLDALARANVTKVAINLRAVQYMSSVGFRPLLQLYGKLKDNHGRVMLCHLAPVVAEVLHVTRMVGTSGSFRAPFEARPDVESAVAALNAPPAT